MRLLNLPRLLLTCNINISDKFFSSFIVTRKKRKKCQKIKSIKDSLKDEWLSDPRFKKCVKRYPGDSKKKQFVLRNKKTIDVAHMGISALASHKTKS